MDPESSPSSRFFLLPPPSTLRSVAPVKMSQPAAGPSQLTAAADKQAPKAKAAENRTKAQQNKQQADANRAAKPSKPAPAAAASKQSKKAASKNAPKPSPSAAKGQFKSKVVIRRLPPNLPEEVFWKAVSPWVRDAADCALLIAPPPGGTEGEASTSIPHAVPTVDYKSFHSGKVKLDANKQNKHARAYVRFLDPTALVEFHKAFDGHIFRDSKGKESVTIVEFAPYQRVHTNSRGRKKDPKQGNIEKDADYLAFVERLSKVDDEGVKRGEGDLLAGLYDAKEKERERERLKVAGKSTPLLEHLRAMKMKKKEQAAEVKKGKKVKAKAKVKEVMASAVVVGDAKGKEVVKKEDKGKEKAEEGGKRKDRKKRSKGKGKVVDAAEGARPSNAPKEGAATPAPKQVPSKGPKKKPDGKTPNANGASKTMNGGEDGASKGGAKGKNKPPRKKAAPKDKSAASTTAPPQPAKIQILKRDT